MNPSKNRLVYEILGKNQKKLIECLEALKPSKEDEQFLGERDFLLNQINQITSLNRENTPISIE